jgi:hypothetical protein
VAIKADLRVVLHAGEVVVAESDDPQLWQRVLAAINGSAEQVGGAAAIDAVAPPASGVGGAIDKFAHRIGITRDQAVGGCDPSAEPPYIHLDAHHWEDLKKNTPARGGNALNGTLVALTLLVLWKEAAGLDAPAVREAAGVANTIGLVDKNAGRTVKNCEWLQERNGQVRINPTQTSKAIAVAHAYCTRSAIGAA